MNEFLVQFKKLIQRVKDLEQSLLKIKSLVMGADEGRFSPPRYTTDPPAPVEGDLWYNMTTHKHRAQRNGSTVDLY